MWNIHHTALSIQRDSVSARNRTGKQLGAGCKERNQFRSIGPRHQRTDMFRRSLSGAHAVPRIVRDGQVDAAVELKGGWDRRYYMYRDHERLLDCDAASCCGGV